MLHSEPVHCSLLRPWCHMPKLVPGVPSSPSDESPLVLEKSSQSLSLNLGHHPHMVYQSIILAESFLTDQFHQAGMVYQSSVVHQAWLEAASISWLHGSLDCFPVSQSSPSGQAFYLALISLQQCLGMSVSLADQRGSLSLWSTSYVLSQPALSSMFDTMR